MGSDRRGTDKLLAPAQIRAARSLLGWSRSDLAKVAGVSASTLKSIENGLADPKASTLRKLSRTFECHGMMFLAEHEWVGVARRVSAIVADQTRLPEDEPLVVPEPKPTPLASKPPPPSRKWLGGLPVPAFRRKA